MSLTEDKSSMLTLTEHILNSITEFTLFVDSIDAEHENFLEVGCYLYRTSPIIMELHTMESTPKNIIELLISLSTNVDHAKRLLKICSIGAKSIKDIELKSITEQLKEAINNIGRDLGTMPSSSFNSNYVALVVQSLSKEMKNACFQVNGAQPCENTEPKRENLLIDMRTESDFWNPVAPVGRNSQRQRYNTYSNDKPHLIDFLKGMYYGAGGNECQSFTTLASLAEYIEPLYDTFFCPLTKKIMEDPVTIDSGVTYERSAITKWLEKCDSDAKALVCPTTGMTLQSRTLSTNLALKTTIQEWTERNEATRLRVAYTALSLAISEVMVLDAVRDLQVLCQRGHKREQMHTFGITELLVQFLDYKDSKVRCETLGLLQSLIEDDKGKEIIAKTEAIKIAVKLLASNNSLERHAAVSFLLEISKSKLLSAHLGEVTDSIFMLITLQNDKSDDPLVAEAAEATLKNLEKYPNNIFYMAENGFLQPLLNQLIEGSEAIQLETAEYLTKFVLKCDLQTVVSEKLSTDLIQIVCGGNILMRKAALKALLHISSHEPNNRTLVEVGIVPIMMDVTFTRNINNELMDMKQESAAILVNILQSGLDPQQVQVNKHGHTMASDYFICNIVETMNCSMPNELNINLIKVLVSLTKLQKNFLRIVTAVKQTKSVETIVDFLSTQHNELIIASIELLIKLSSHFGQTIAERLCKTQGQPEGLIGMLNSNQTHSIKKQAMSFSLLAKLPHENLTLNLALLHKSAVPIILQRINEIQTGEVMTGNWTRTYLEGLVGTLVRFTSTLYETDILCMAKQQNLASVLTGLMVINGGSDEVQRLAAMGLQKLSSESINLTKKRPEKPKQKKANIFLCSCFGMKQKAGGYTRVMVQVCPVHKGECSSNTFCLLEAKALKVLVSCLESENDGVVEAALGAISTLLDDRVDVERSVVLLSEFDAVKTVMGILRERTQGRVWEKTLWVIERFLVGGGEGIANDISRDRLLSRALVNAFHRGDGATRTVAERILRQLNLIHSSRQG